MKIVFSRHAKRQMKWRNISEENVREAVLHPEKIEASIQGRKNSFKHFNEQWIKVTYKEEGEKITVVTAMDKGIKEKRHED